MTSATLWWQPISWENATSGKESLLRTILFSQLVSLSIISLVIHLVQVQIDIKISIYEFESASNVRWVRVCDWTRTVFTHITRQSPLSAVIVFMLTFLHCVGTTHKETHSNLQIWVWACDWTGTMCNITHQSPASSAVFVFSQIGAAQNLVSCFQAWVETKQKISAFKNLGKNLKNRKEYLLTTIRFGRIENMVSWLYLLYLFVVLCFSDEQTKGIAGSIWWGLSAFSLTVSPSHFPYGRY